MEFDALLEKVDKIIASVSNRDETLLEICDLLKSEVDHYDWVGFYLLNPQKNNLELGPYSGKHTEHVTIPIGRGVCGQVAESKKSLVVQDVSKIDKYIACSLEVQSEIVVPVLKNNIFVAEIDIDSHARAPFTDKDIKLLESICTILAPLF